MPSSYLSPGVYVEEVSSGSKPIEAAGTAVAAFVGFAERGPVNQPVLVTNWTQFTQTFGGFMPGSYLAHAVYGYFANGGGTGYVVRIGGQAPSVVRGELPAAGDEPDRPAFTVRALATNDGDGAPPADLTVEVTPTAGGPDDAFTLVVKQGGRTVETLEGLTTKRGPTNVVTAVKQQSTLIAVEEVKGRPVLAPRKGAAVTLAAEPAAELAVSARDYVGDVADRTGFAGLEAIDEITMLCVPDLMAARQQDLLDDEGVLAVQAAMITHCELMADRVAILDTPPGLTAQQVKRWRAEANVDSKYAAVYYPWIKVMDPVAGRPAFLPPSGHVAGIWARNDATRGVHKAPANEIVRGAIALELNLTKGEHDQLNPDGINCIRTFPGQGIRVWGARTLSSDPEWRYLNVRRLFNYVEKSILQGTNWVVFEPNDPKLWDSVNRTVTMFLRRVWRDGALFGRTPAEAFYVKCDEENNPPENRDAGMLTVEIGIAPVKPAEFVIFRISQFAEGAGLEE
ncbi:phage tail sheath family protein [Planosporangium sp. 12N6]|uniref:phage tail sheath family protein n=1 Tax=Planosporangium spinosum TaxID=3402278 RepID=UPI003CF8022A